MPYSISTLLVRNLQDVFGENDPARRRAAAAEIYTEDCVFYDPNKGVHRGPGEIERIAGEIRATHPEFRYQPVAEPEEAGNGGRIRWVAGSSRGAGSVPADLAKESDAGSVLTNPAKENGVEPVYAGTDFIVTRDGRIAAIYLFFDKLP